MRLFCATRRGGKSECAVNLYIYAELLSLVFLIHCVT